MCPIDFSIRLWTNFLEFQQSCKLTNFLAEIDKIFHKCDLSSFRNCLVNCACARTYLYVLGCRRRPRHPAGCAGAGATSKETRTRRSMRPAKMRPFAGRRQSVVGNSCDVGCQLLTAAASSCTNNGQSHLCRQSASSHWSAAALSVSSVLNCNH